MKATGRITSISRGGGDRASGPLLGAVVRVFRNRHAFLSVVFLPLRVRGGWLPALLFAGAADRDDCWTHEGVVSAGGRGVSWGHRLLGLAVVDRRIFGLAGASLDAGSEQHCTLAIQLLDRGPQFRLALCFVVVGSYGTTGRRLEPPENLNYGTMDHRHFSRAMANPGNIRCFGAVLRVRSA